VDVPSFTAFYRATGIPSGLAGGEQYDTPAAQRAGARVLAELLDASRAATSDGSR
jgi:hypothetical protein